MPDIFHIAIKRDWEAMSTVRQRYWPKHPAGCNFIHCSFKEQVLRVADRLFTGRVGLVLLEINFHKVKNDLLIEPAPPDNEMFPHIYRALNIEDTKVEHDFTPDVSGRFSFPS